MKLQKNNKYSKRIISGIANILLAGSILIGCNNIEAFASTAETTIDEIQEDEVNKKANVKEEVREEFEKDENYYLYYYMISNAQKEARVARLDIKYPEIEHLGSHVKTLVVKDKDVYKILPVIELWDYNNNVSHFYDLFTEEQLFEYPFNDVSEIIATPDYEYGEYIGGYDFNKIKNAIPYFDDKKIVEFGECFYAQTFFEKHLDEFSKRDGINYKIGITFILRQYYTLPFNVEDIMIKPYDYAINYVTTVPLENQVTSEELGLKPTYRIEDKYSDYWKLSNEEIEERLKDYEIEKAQNYMFADQIFSLVLKDKDDNYKLMYAAMSTNDSGDLEFYDIFTDMHLFNVKTTGIVEYDDVNDECKNIDLKSMYDEIPYFEDKELIKVSDFFGCPYFVENNYKYFVEKDGIQYKPLEKSYYYNMYPDNGKDDFNLKEIRKTKEEYARFYIISMPEDMQVTTKDLKMGLEIDNEKVKTLEK